MKKTLFNLALLALSLLLLLTSCNKEKAPDFGTLTIADVTVSIGESKDVAPVFSKESYDITYSFEGNNIKIENGRITPLVGGTETVVTAKTSHHEVTFKVTVPGPEHQDYGTLTVNDIIGLREGKMEKIAFAFSIPSKEEKIEYIFDGEDIRIENGRVIALVPDKTVTVTAKTAHHETTFKVTTLESLGTLTIENVYAYIAMPDPDFYPVFSKPEKAEKLTYSYNEEGIKIDAEKGTIKALKPGSYVVNATSENFKESFTVTVREINKGVTRPDGEKKYYPEKFSSQSANRLSQWEDNGNDGVTTVFIGDSFFDTNYWSDFYTAHYPDKDALLLGISATTTYDWEVWATKWLKNLDPKNIVMHIGTNNIYDDGDDANTAIESLQRLFTLLHAKFPDTHIYWFGISQRSYDDAKIKAVATVNATMKNWCDLRSYITYIDTPSALTNDMLKDNVHPKLECYTVFTEALAKTDIKIENKKAEPKPYSGDIVIQTSQSIANGTSLKSIVHKDETLSRNYVISGKLDITAVANNPHVQFGILDNGTERILLWNNENNGKFKLVIPYTTNGIPDEDIYTFESGKTLTIVWKLVVTDNDAYFYINDELKLVYTALKEGNQTLRLGAEGTECKFYDIKVLTLKGDAADYNAALEEIKDDISSYGDTATASKIRV